MGIYTRAMGALLAVNTQVAVIIWGGFWLSDMVREESENGDLWCGVIFCLATLAVVHSYYVMFRYLMRLDKKLRGEKHMPNGGD